MSRTSNVQWKFSSTQAGKMELTVDLNVHYGESGLANVVKRFNLKERVAGKEVSTDIFEDIYGGREKNCELRG